MGISVLISTRDRPETLKTCLRSVYTQNILPDEIIVLDDAPAIASARHIVNEFNNTKVSIKYVCTDKAKGVAGTRNLLIAMARFEYLVFIDDDAYLSQQDAFQKIIANFEEYSQVGILATNIINVTPSGNTLLLPISGRSLSKNPIKTNEKRLVSVYVGAFHVIRSSVMKDVGFYKEDMVYGSEELDLSYRLIEHGYQILFDSSLTAHHVPQASVVSSNLAGRNRNIELYHNLKNRFYLAHKYLPVRYSIIYSLSWFFIYLKMLKYNEILFYLTSVLPNAIKYASKERKTVLSASTISYLRKNYGRLYF